MSFIAHVFEPNSTDNDENPATEMIFDLKARSMEDAKNELFGYFGLIAGQSGYYPSQQLGSAKIYEVVNTVTVDVDAQRAEKAQVEAEMLAEQESRREMAQFEKSRQKHRNRR